MENTPPAFYTTRLDGKAHFWSIDTFKPSVCIDESERYRARYQVILGCLTSRVDASVTPQNNNGRNYALCYNRLMNDLCNDQSVTLEEIWNSVKPGGTIDKLGWEHLPTAIIRRNHAGEVIIEKRI